MKKVSCSSLFKIDKEFYGEETVKYQNSWFFCPMIWSVLSDKYLPKVHGRNQSVIFDQGVWYKINDIMNNSDNTCERVCWEILNQQIFFTKDKDIIADAILEFVNTHKQYYKNEDNKGALEKEHIIERFEEIAEGIRSLNEDESPYFVFKNTSCDDGVERWFSKYDEEADETQKRSLKDIDEFVAEFVVIQDGKIQEFISNDEFEYK